MDVFAELRELEQLAGQTIENMTLPPEGSSLVDIIMHTTRDFHSDKTGGTLHRVGLPVARIVAGFIEYMGGFANWFAPEYFGFEGVDYTKIDPATGKYTGPSNDLQVFVHYLWQAAVIAGETCFDPYAQNPNNQNGKPDDSPVVIAERTDYGIGQFNGAKYERFLGVFGIADAMWAMQGKLAGDLVWAASLKIPEVTSQTADPVVSAIVLAGEAYNKGQIGALESDEFSYGEGVVSRYEAYCKILGVPAMAIPITEMTHNYPFANKTYALADLKKFAAEERAKWAK